jgi:hypothetical protein
MFSFDAMNRENELIFIKCDLLDVYKNNKRYLTTLRYDNFNELNIYDLRTLVQALLLYIPLGKVNSLDKCNKLLVRIDKCID